MRVVNRNLALIRLQVLLTSFVFAGMAAVGTAAEIPAEDKKPSLDAVLKLQGKALFDAARDLQDSKLSDADLLKITDRLATQFKSAATHDDQYLITSYFEDACRETGPAELDGLAVAYAKIPAGSFDKESILKYLAVKWIDRELATIKTEHPRVTFPEVNSPLPGGLEKAPKELRNAYFAFKRSIQPYERAFPRDREIDSISFQNNRKSFFGLVQKVIDGREKGLADKLFPYLWSGGCGVGAASFEEPRSLAIFMALLRERKLAEAIGAALSIMPDSLGRPGNELFLSRSGKIDIRIEFLKMCGLDWEDVLAGAKVDSENRDFFLGWDSAFLCELAAFGSDRAALLIEQMARRAKPEARELYARVIGALVNQGPKSDVSYSSDYVERIAPPISSGARRRLLGVLRDFATADAPTRLATAILSSLERAHDRTAVPALRSLLTHPSPDVVAEANRLLRDFGEEAAISLKKDPVRFQVLVNGEPLQAGLDVSWSVVGESGGLVSSIGEVDDDGILGIERSHFLNPERKPGEVFLERYEKLGQPCFGVAVPVTADLDTVRSINVETAAIKLILRNIRHGVDAAKEKARVEVRRAQKERRGLLGAFPAEFTFPINQPIVIDGLQVGTYDLTVSVPGHERWQQSVLAKLGSTPIDVSLRPGGDVHAKIVLPENSKQRVDSVLLNNGQQVDGFYADETDTYRGLPVGNYVLHVPSAEEMHSLGIPGEDILGPDEIDYAAHDVAFVISENSPTLIDLGELRLERAGKSFQRKNGTRQSQR